MPYVAMLQSVQHEDVKTAHTEKPDISAGFDSVDVIEGSISIQK
jgi:hypothetical protein